MPSTLLFDTVWGTMKKAFLVLLPAAMGIAACAVSVDSEPTVDELETPSVEPAGNSDWGDCQLKPSWKETRYLYASCGTAWCGGRDEYAKLIYERTCDGCSCTSWAYVGKECYAC